MVSLVNTFLSYLLLLLVIVVLSAGAVALGLFLRKKKNEKSADEIAAVEENTES